MVVLSTSIGLIPSFIPLKEQDIPPAEHLLRIVKELKSILDLPEGPL
jgi:hypothetical protein